MTDATVAINDGAATKMVQRLLQKPVNAHNEGSWGPFYAGYDVALSFSGGKVEFVDLAGNPLLRLSEVETIGFIYLYVGLDLNQILPQICIPPVQICISTPWGDACTPQVCVNWPRVSVPAVILPIPDLGLGADFVVDIRDGGTDWNVYLGLKTVPPFSIDLSPLAKRILDAVRITVHDVLSVIPLIGDLVGDLVNTVLGFVEGIIISVLHGVAEFLRMLILAFDLFAPSVPIKLTHLAKAMKILASGGPDDPEVDVLMSAVQPSVDDHDLILECALA